MDIDIGNEAVVIRADPFPQDEDREPIDIPIIAPPPPPGEDEAPPTGDQPEAAR